MRELLFLIAFGLSAQAMAQDAAPAAAATKAKDAAPPIDKWIEETKAKAGAFPRTIVFVTALPAKGKGAPTFKEIDGKSFNAVTFLRAADTANAEWDLKLNKAKYEDTDAAEAAISLTKADVIVLAPEKGDWQIISFKAGKRETIAKAKPPKSSKAEDIAAWMFTTLNWDGVVLEQRGDYLLVGSTALALGTPQIQALAVDKSAEKWKLSAAEKKGAGLLSLSEAKTGYGIFDVVFLGQGVTTLPTGAKIIIEKKK
jgi:hypothetical protein